MYFSCDVGKFLNSERGLLDVKNYDYESLMGTTFGMDKKQRIQTFSSGSSHAMTLMAVDLDKDGKPVKWMVENSWGADSGYKGHLIMTDEWFGSGNQIRPCQDNGTLQTKARPPAGMGPDVCKRLAVSG